MSNAEDYLTVKEAASRLKLHPNSVRTMIQKGQLEAIKINRQYRVLPAAIQQLGVKAVLAR